MGELYFFQKRLQRKKFWIDLYFGHDFGFGSSIFLDWKNGVEKQTNYMVSQKLNVDFPHVRVESYHELKEKILHDEI